MNKSFIVAMLVDGTEANSTLEMMMNQMNIWDCACKYCNDLKVSANLCGLMAGWPKFPCPYCEASQDELDTLGQMRTIESLFQHYEDYEQHCRHLKTVKQKRMHVKNMAVLKINLC